MRTKWDIPTLRYTNKNRQKQKLSPMKKVMLIKVQKVGGAVSAIAQLMSSSVTKTPPPSHNYRKRHSFQFSFVMLPCSATQSPTLVKGKTSHHLQHCKTFCQFWKCSRRLVQMSTSIFWWPIKSNKKLKIFHDISLATSVKLVVLWDFSFTLVIFVLCFQ